MTGAIAGAGVGAHDIMGVGMGVPLSLVGAAPASTSLLAERGLQQELRQA